MNPAPTRQGQSWTSRPPVGARESRGPRRPKMSPRLGEMAPKQPKMAPREPEMALRQPKMAPNLAMLLGTWSTMRSKSWMLALSAWVAKTVRGTATVGGRARDASRTSRCPRRPSRRWTEARRAPQWRPAGAPGAPAKRTRKRAVRLRQALSDADSENATNLQELLAQLC